MKKIILSLSLIMLISLSLIGCNDSDGDGAHTHAFGEWDIAVAAKCDADGLKTRACACGETEEEVIPAGHAPTDWKIMKNPTCTTAGERTRGCSMCGIVLDKETIPANGHEVAVYTYNNNATLNRDGTATGKCSVCKKNATIQVEGTSAQIKAAFEGKTFSVLGDSISTYLNVSNGDAADTTNSTIRDGVLYYDQQKIDDMGVTLNSTWWQRTINSFGGSLLVNNSWSGSYIKDTSTNTRPTAGAYVSRALNLHDDTGENAGEEPDIILIYMGTNDFYKYKSGCGSVNDYSSIPEKASSDYVPTSVAEAYAIMLYKISEKYKNAEIYCLNVLEGPSSDEYELSYFNNMLKDVAQQYGAKYVDICEKSGIKNDSFYETYIPSDDGDGTKNTLHPNAAGMAKISDCVINTIIEESKFTPEFPQTIEK